MLIAIGAVGVAAVLVQRVHPPNIPTLPHCFHVRERVRVRERERERVRVCVCVCMRVRVRVRVKV